ncbi:MULTISPECIES: NADH-quinone oxidoreductase subunit B family protein [unclassified Butyrivibrio]|jgi:ech hydrogenase subunit C|uniref:NADH-quinone oxidoreductase subunit B family protein n=1 Tax=unclassified Butyrivibrio TaxID=2639466 RepID=UPI0003F837F8|nr:MULTISPECIES: NADH-quinone oxidoreductase subunit NuoB [unclassified Butyrivibrio]
MKISKSPWVLHYDGSSCNGCDIEVLATMTPLYDVERFGIINTGNPKHADILLLTGGINAQTAPVVRQLYNQMPDPKVVIACGICSCDGGIFKECYNILGGSDKVVPVDVYVPGCAVRPEALIDGVVKALAILEEKRVKVKESMKQGYCTVDYSKIAVRMKAEDYDPATQYDAVLTEEALREQAEAKIAQTAKPAPKPAAPAAAANPAPAATATAAPKKDEGGNA